MKTETNGTTAATTESEDTLLERLHKEWLAAGGKPITKAEGKKLWDEYMKAQKAKDAAEEALEAATAKLTATVTNVVRARGKGSFNPPDGSGKATPACRGSLMFMKRERAAVSDM